MHENEFAVPPVSGKTKADGGPSGPLSHTQDRAKGDYTSNESTPQDDFCESPASMDGKTMDKSKKFA